MKYYPDYHTIIIPQPNLLENAYATPMNKNSNSSNDCDDEQG